MPGLRSSRTLRPRHQARPPAATRRQRTIEAEELAAKAGYSRPHTVHCGPGGIFMSALGGANGNDGPGGVALLDHDTFEVVERLGDRPGRAVLRLRRLVAPQPRHRHHIGVGDAVDDRERAQPRGPARPQVRPPPELLEPVRAQAHRSASTSATSTRWCSSCGPLTTPRKTWGFVGVVISVEDLSASVWLWHQDGDRWARRQGDHDPGRAGRRRAAAARACSPSARCRRWSPTSTCRSTTAGCTSSCWGTGELKQYDVSDPFAPARDRLGAARRDRAAANPTPRRPTCRWPADRRWSRSAATAGASTSPTRCTRPGTTCSTRTASAPGWPSSTRTS